MGSGKNLLLAGKEVIRTTKRVSTSIERYNEKGLLIYSKSGNGKEESFTFDDQDRLILTEDNKGRRIKRLYNDKGLLVEILHGDGRRHIMEYNDNNKRIHSIFIYASGEVSTELWYDYDKNGFMNHTKDSEGFEEWYDYDEKGNMLHCKDSNGLEEWREFNEQGKLILSRDSEGKEKKVEYSEDGKIIYKEFSNGHTYHYEYDEKGRIRRHWGNLVDETTDYNDEGFISSIVTADGSGKTTFEYKDIR